MQMIAFVLKGMKSVCNKVVKEKAPLVLEERRACQLPIKKLEVMFPSLV